MAMAASFWRLSLTTVSVNMRVSSSVFPSGTSTTYDSTTTQYGRPAPAVGWVAIVLYYYSSVILLSLPLYLGL